MRKLVYLGLSCFMVLIAGCSNDDDNNNSVEQENVLRIGDTEYELKSGVIEDYGNYEGNIFNFDITLISSAVSFVDGELVPDDQFISGIYFELFTNSQNDLSTGIYNKVNFENIGQQTFEYAEIAENIEFNNEDETGTFSELTQGSIEVLSNGPEYELEFSGVNDLGQSISGYYKGSLLFLDSSE